MERYIFICLFALIFSFSNAQELKNTGEFYKTTTNILTAINTFDEVNNGGLEKKTAILRIEKNLNAIKPNYDLAKEKFPNDEDFKEYELWVLTIRKSLEMLKDNDPTFAFGCSLIKMNMFDFMNSKY